jgi:peptidyl-prolyl cis-trans isomerase D
MLQAIRDRAMGVLGWIVIGLIIITFALFGLGSYLQDKSRVYVAKVNDAEITPGELQVAYQNQRARMEQMLGEAFNPALINEQILKRQALDNLIRRQLILQAAESEGMAISDQLLAAQIHSVSAFQEDGEFKQERYQRLLAQQGQTPAGFEYETRRMLVADQLINGVSNTAFVTSAEVDRAYALQQQKRSFDYILVSAEPFKSGIEPGEAEIKAYYEQRSDMFMQPERVRLAYIRLNGEVLGKDIEISEDALNQHYQQKKDSLKTQEQRRASHILFQVAPDADEASIEKIRSEAELVLQQIREGGDFAKLAKQHSDDPGSKDQGGDLGYFATGAMVPEFDKTVFAMETGDVSDLVRTQFGFHVIKLVDIRGSEIPPLEDVREELIAELKQQDIEDLYYEQLDQLTDISYENPESLDAAADALGLEIQTTDWLNANSGTDIGEYPKIRAAAFSEDVLEAGNNSEPVEIGPNDAVVLRIRDREPSQPMPLEEVREQIVTALKQEQAAQAAREKGEKLSQQLAEDARMKDLAGEQGLSFHEADALERNAQGHAAELMRYVFRLSRPAEGETADTGFALANGDYAVVRLKTVTDADPADMTEEERTQLKRGFENMRRNLALSTMVNALRSQAKVDIPEDSDNQP